MLTHLLESEKERAVTQMSGVNMGSCPITCACNAANVRELRAVLDSYGRGLLAGVRDFMRQDIDKNFPPENFTMGEGAVRPYFAHLMALLDEAMKHE